jgi:hypothetical protein
MAHHPSNRGDLFNVFQFFEESLHLSPLSRVGFDKTSLKRHRLRSRIGCCMEPQKLDLQDDFHIGWVFLEGLWVGA